MENSPNLKLPYIMPQQAQKHVTHNEAIRALDALVQLTVLSFAAIPPQAPEDGDRYAILSEADGAWLGKTGQIAAWQDGAWSYFEPRSGWQLHDNSTGKQMIFNGTDWITPTIQVDALQNLTFAGVNATADPANRLAVSSPASLFDHEGGSHRLTVNKASSEETASLLFQNQFYGTAEMGIMGDDNFAVKVADSSGNWIDAMKINRETGSVDFPGGMENAQLSGVVDNLDEVDRIYVDAINGDDANDGRTASTAIKTANGLAARFSLGRRVEVRLLSDLVFDQMIAISYPVNCLNIFGRTALDTGWEDRKIIVTNASNSGSFPGSFIFRSFANLYTFKIDIELATDRPHAFFNYYNTTGFLRTHTMNVTRTGTGTCCLFSNGASFVPSHHTNLVVDQNAKAFIASGIGEGVDPNSDWRYPCNLTQF